VRPFLSASFRGRLKPGGPGDMYFEACSSVASISKSPAGRACLRTLSLPFGPAFPCPVCPVSPRRHAHAARPLLPLRSASRPPPSLSGPQHPDAGRPLRFSLARHHGTCR